MKRIILFLVLILLSAVIIFTCPVYPSFEKEVEHFPSTFKDASYISQHMADFQISNINNFIILDGRTIIASPTGEFYISGQYRYDDSVIITVTVYYGDVFKPHRGVSSQEFINSVYITHLQTISTSSSISVMDSFSKSEETYIVESLFSADKNSQAISIFARELNSMILYVLI